MPERTDARNDTPTLAKLALCGWFALGSIATAQGRVVTPASFGPNTIVESFEGQLTITVDQDFIPFDGGTLPFGGVDVGYVFPSGLVLSGMSASPDGVVLYDWSAGFVYNQAWLLFSAGAIFGTTVLPSGTSFLGHDNDEHGAPLELTLPAPAFRVGAFVESRDFGVVTLRAYDAGGGLVGSAEAVPDGVIASGLDTFVGLEAGVPIARIEFSGPHVAVDEIAFDPDSARSYGSGCAGSGGFTPKLFVSGVTQPGAPIEIDVGQGLGGAPAVVMVGTGAADFPIGGSCSLLVFPVVASLPLTLDGTGPGTGQVSVATSLPSSLPVGAHIALQAWVADPMAAAGAAASNAVEFDVLP